jgi:ABC-type transport system involved in multi-copper enzyme maturation permease subunit
MTIKERGYTHWDGELQDGRFPWWPITRIGIKLTFKRKFFKFFFALTLIPALVWLVGIYVSERLEDFKFMMEGDQTDFLNVNPLYFKTYFTNEFLLFMIIMILVFCGAGLIADDLKHNALQLYFARPLKKRDYLTGKAAVIFFFLFIVTLVPGIVFIFFKLVFAGNLQFFTSYPWLILSVLAYSILITTFFSFYTLLLSSIGKNRRYVAILIFGVYIFSDIFSAIFYEIFHSRYFYLLSIKSNLQQVGAVLFDQRTPWNIPWYYSLMVIVAICLFSAYMLKRKVRGVEIIK